MAGKEIRGRMATGSDKRRRRSWGEVPVGRKQGYRRGRKLIRVKE